jgi:hypothetical protein
MPRIRAALECCCLVNLSQPAEAWEMASNIGTIGSHVDLTSGCDGHQANTQAAGASIAELVRCYRQLS